MVCTRTSKEPQANAGKGEIPASRLWLIPRLPALESPSCLRSLPRLSTNKADSLDQGSEDSWNG